MGVEYHIRQPLAAIACIPRSINILLAEDKDDDVALIRHAFADAKFVDRVEVVPDGVETLAYLRGETGYEDAPKADLLLLDINMPRKDGFDVLDEIKSDAVLSGPPVIVLSTSQRDADVSRCYSSGACTYVSKPASFDRIREIAVQGIENYWTSIATLPRADS